MKTVSLFFQLLENRFWVALRDFAFALVFGFLGIMTLWFGGVLNQYPGGTTFNMTFGILFCLLTALLFWWWLRGEFPTMMMHFRVAKSWATLPEPTRTWVIKAHRALLRAQQVAKAHAFLSIANPEDYHTDWQEVRLSETIGEGFTAAVYVKTPLHGKRGEIIVRQKIIATKSARLTDVQMLCSLLGERWQHWEGITIE